MDEDNRFRRALRNPIWVGALCIMAGSVLYDNFSDLLQMESNTPALPLVPFSRLPSQPTSASFPPSSPDPSAIHWIHAPPRDPFSSMAPITQREVTPEAVNHEAVAKTPETASSPTLVLKAIAMEGKGRSAVINRGIVHEGERIDGCEVLVIELQGVWLACHGTRHFLTFTERTVSNQS